MTEREARNRVLAAVVLALLAIAVALAQEAPALTALETCYVDVSLLNETIVRLKIEKADLEKRLDILQLQLDRERRTPAPKDGLIWSWETDPKTGRPKGYVKAPAKDDEAGTGPAQNRTPVP